MSERIGEGYPEMDLKCLIPGFNPESSYTKDSKNST